MKLQPGFPVRVVYVSEIKTPWYNIIYCIQPYQFTGFFCPLASICFRARVSEKQAAVSFLAGVNTQVHRSCTKTVKEMKYYYYLYRKLNLVLKSCSAKSQKPYVVEDFLQPFLGHNSCSECVGLGSSEVCQHAA